MNRSCFISSFREDVLPTRTRASSGGPGDSWLSVSGPLSVEGPDARPLARRW